MAASKRNQEKAVQHEEAASTTTAWRKPISLAGFEAEDPLEQLYRGREANKLTDQSAGKSAAQTVERENNLSKPERPQIAATKKAKANLRTAVKTRSNALKTAANDVSEFDDEPLAANTIEILSETDLKKILKIKSEFFRFTDIQEILRGKSLDIYAFLRVLAGDAGFCKIKHLDLMKKLEISRPTLFKQQEWLVGLRLIEKRNVPGDHSGTSYTVHRLEDVLPVPKIIVKQLHARIESIGKENN